MAIKKIFTNLNIDRIEGDCIEFGIFTGSSFKHAIRTENKINQHNKTKFFGLDSFEGFPENDHPFFQDINFVTDYSKVKKIVQDYDVSCINLYEVFENIEDPQRFFPFGMIGHYNVEGYRKIGEKVFELTK